MSLSETHPRAASRAWRRSARLARPNVRCNGLSGAMLCLQRFELAKVLAHDRAQPVGFRAPPIALELAGESKNRSRNHAGLNHALHGGFMRHSAYTADG